MSTLGKIFATTFPEIHRSQLTSSEADEYPTALGNAAIRELRHLQAVGGRDIPNAHGAVQG